MEPRRRGYTALLRWRPQDDSLTGNVEVSTVADQSATKQWRVPLALNAKLSAAKLISWMPLGALVCPCIGRLATSGQSFHALDSSRRCELHARLAWLRQPRAQLLTIVPLAKFEYS